MKEGRQGPWGWHDRWHRTHGHGPHGHGPFHHRFHRRLRHYYGAHLHRRLFVWFGFTIVVTAAVVGLTVRLTGHPWSGRPPNRLAILGVAIVTLWILTGKIARWLAQPLGELVNVANEIGRGNLSARARLAKRGVGEIATLAGSINDMAARIERQLAAERELLAAVSHELRTPLARLRVLLEIARERGATANTWDEHERELLEMDRLVGELLASARLDFQALSTRPLDAIEVASRALERATLPAERLTRAAPETGPLPFAGDPTLVSRALANLIDNASKHGGGLERLLVRARPGFVVFEVEDRGPGFAPGMETRAFQPFVRGAEGERQADGNETSLGLGLALVARIARAHGGSVTASNRQEGGGKVVLELAENPPRTAPRTAPDNLAH
jgi:two-component system, OmpR family, sensor kinase